MKTLSLAAILMFSLPAFSSASVCPNVPCAVTGGGCNPNGANDCHCKWPMNNGGAVCCGHDATGTSSPTHDQILSRVPDTCNSATTVDKCCSGILDGGCCCSKLNGECQNDRDCCGAAGLHCNETYGGHTGDYTCIACTAASNVCNRDAECCSGSTCGTWSGTCFTPGAAACNIYLGTCCSGNCNGVAGVNGGNGTCVCGLTGSLCVNPNGCCSGSCNTMTGYCN